jgi:hypothetical protein
MYKQVILNHLLDYLKIKNVVIKKSGKVIMLECPFCKTQPLSANIIPNTSVINCYKCNKKYNLMDLVKYIENKTNEDEIYQYLKELLKIEVMTKKDEDELIKTLDFYEKNGFDLVPIEKNGKRPIEKDWTNKTHKSKEEWLEWIRNGLNIGVKTGVRSGITIIDIDQKPIPEEIRLMVGNTLIQETKKGFHLFYKYDKDLPKTRIEELKIDIETTGGQVVLYPSIVENEKRNFISGDKIIEIPKDLKGLLKSKIELPALKSFSEKLRDDIKSEDFKLEVIKEGEGRNNFLIHLGGILRKELSIKQTEYVMNAVNNHFCSPPLSQKEIIAMVGQLDKYIEFDEQELALKVLQYLRNVEDGTRTDVERAIGEKKARTDKVLAYLVKEGYLLKRGKSYHIIKKADWKDTLIDIGKPVPFTVPYFYDVANYNWGDLLLIGSKAKYGKTHISMNIIKKLQEQGVKPYYISLETGSRFAKIALQLGLKEGDFYHTFCADPTKIELEPNAVTIIDWLLIVDKAKTDLIFRHFIEQLNKTNGFLIIFQQLKQDSSWFAENMCKQFPALATRYLYENDNEGTYGKYIIDVVREPKPFGKKVFEIPCVYNWKTKELKRIDELNEEEGESGIPVKE